MAESAMVNIRSAAKSVVFYLLIPAYVLLVPTFLLATVLGLGLIVAAAVTMVTTAQLDLRLAGARFAVLSATFIALALTDRAYRWAANS